MEDFLDLLLVGTSLETFDDAGNAIPLTMF